MTRPRRVLVADDDPIQSFIASEVLGRDGFEVSCARNGLEALALFESIQPDLVLTDYHMPGMDGLALTRAIRERSAERLVPVVVITARTEPEILHASLEAGALEFLTKPFATDELLARVRALTEMASLHEHLREEMARHELELTVVKHVLERFQALGRIGLPDCFAMETLHTQRIKGDTCLFRQGLPGIYFGLICDATGHGLMAGVSTIPVVEAFLSMVTKDIPLQAIYREINVKLRRLLPADRFVCLTLFRVNTHQGVLSVLNAGMPDALLLKGDGHVRTFPSTELPAGIRETAAEDVHLVDVSVTPGDRFLTLSDGMVDLFPGMDLAAHLLSDFSHLPLPEHHEEVRRRVQARVADAEMADDITWALWQIPGPPAPVRPPFAETPTEANLVPGLEVSIRARDEFHNLSGFLPTLHNLLMNEGVDKETLQSLALLVGEALVNAVDHGILGLSSHHKSFEGFEGYELRRQEALAAQPTGEITLRLTLLREDRAGGHPRRIDIEVEDTGPGFDWSALLENFRGDSSLMFGRGLAIIAAMSEHLSFNAKGNLIRFGIRCPTR